MASIPDCHPRWCIFGRVISAAIHDGAGGAQREADKSPDFVLGKTGIVLEKRGIWHGEAQPLLSCNSPRGLSKCKHLIAR